MLKAISDVWLINLQDSHLKEIMQGRLILMSFYMCSLVELTFPRKWLYQAAKGLSLLQYQM